MRNHRLLLGLMSAAMPAIAKAQADDGTCRNGGFPTNNPTFALARVAAAGRTSFFLDSDGCPAMTRACRGRPHVVAGDHLVTGRRQGAFTCAFYPSRGYGVAGWIETARLIAVPIDPRPTAVRWAGRWSVEGNPAVRFAAAGGRLRVDGDAYWPSPDTDRPGGPHVGAIAGSLQVAGNRAREPECNVSFTLLGDLLVAADPDMRCGGANVSFSGVYRRVVPGDARALRADALQRHPSVRG